MPAIHHDLPMTSYALLGLLAIGQEALGLQTALLMAAGLISLWVALSLFAALLAQLQKAGPAAPCPP